MLEVVVMRARGVALFASVMLVGVSACTGDESVSEADTTPPETTPSSVDGSPESAVASGSGTTVPPTPTGTLPMSADVPGVGVFSFATHDLCDWVTGDDVAEFMAAEFDWEGTADEGTTPQQGGCKWTLTSRDGIPGWVHADVWELSQSGTVVPYEESVDTPARFNVSVSGHPDLSDGVVVRNGGYFTFEFWTPPRTETLLLWLSATEDVGTDAELDDYWPRFFGVADRFMDELNWLSNIQHIDYEGGATYLTGEIKRFMLAEGTVTTDADGNEHTRDGIVSYQVVSDDPRVAGDVTGTWNTDRWGTSINDGAMVQWGHATLSNEHGTWEAPYEGAFASPYGDIVTRWWTGTGDYDGLTFYMWVPGSSIGVPHFDWHGIIFPGDPPTASLTE